MELIAGKLVHMQLGPKLDSFSWQFGRLDIL